MWFTYLTFYIQRHICPLPTVCVQYMYVEILKENLKQSAAKRGLGRRFVFQHDNDPKPMSLLVKNYLQKTKEYLPKKNRHNGTSICTV
uniref:Uncharacterized protein n=1 Tax=Paramormyrops kingsleyae TaxID=1676925 RepID=A0A3B3SJT5_9TELE